MKYEFPKDVFQLYELVEEFSKQNPECPIVFSATNKIKVCHLITSHSSEIISMLNCIPTPILDAFGEVIMNHLEKISIKE